MNKLYYGMSAGMFAILISTGANVGESVRASLIPLLFVFIPMVQKTFNKAAI
jgi:hypothetical protein